MYPQYRKFCLYVIHQLTLLAVLVGIYYLYVVNIVGKESLHKDCMVYTPSSYMYVYSRIEFSILLFLLFTYIPSGRALKYHRCHHLFYSENHCIQYNIGFIRYKSFENIITSIFILFYILCCVQRFYVLPFFFLFIHVSLPLPHSLTLPLHILWTFAIVWKKNFWIYKKWGKIYTLLYTYIHTEFKGHWC